MIQSLQVRSPLPTCVLMRKATRNFSTHAACVLVARNALSREAAIDIIEWRMRLVPRMAEHWQEVRAEAHHAHDQKWAELRDRRMELQAMGNPRSCSNSRAANAVSDTREKVFYAHAAYLQASKRLAKVETALGAWHERVVVNQNRLDTLRSL